MSKNKKGFETRSIHSGQSSDPSTGAVMTPIYATSTYEQDGPGEHKGYEYTRSSNPTRKALEECISDLENGGSGHAFASGMAATSTIIDLLDSGDHIVACDDLYGGTYRLFENVKKRSSGIKTDFIDFSDLNKIENAITDKTKMIWVETPTNPMMNLIDVQSLSEICKKNKVLLAVDNTFATPYLQKPLDLGADIVMHSATKYLAGHSDVILGALIVKDDQLAEKLYFLQNASGAICGPMDSFLTLRGIKTLHVRMERHCFNAEKIVNFLANHERVDKLYWPGIPTHPNHKLAKSQMSGFGGMVSFTTKDGDFKSVQEITSKFKVFTLAESLGGVESLVGHPASMTHASIPKKDREIVGVIDSLVRFSVGIEDLEDLVEDIDQALK